jgi:hypothetical protein
MTDERMPVQEPHVEAFLATLADAPVPGDLAFAVSSHVRERPSRRPSFRLPLLAAAAGLLLTVSVAMAAGWQPPFDILPGPQEAGSLPAPTASLETPAPADTWEFATVAVEGAEMVVDPAIPEAVGFTEGYAGANPVLVLERRVVDGRTWVRIEAGGWVGEARFVWIPETIPSVAPAGYEVTVLERTSYTHCSGAEPPTIESLGSVTAAQRLACHGAGSFTLGPVQVVPTWDDTANTGTPEWLGGPITTMLQGPMGEGDTVPIVPVRVRPDSGVALLPHAWVTVTAHLDDPASASCVRQTTDVSGAPVGEPSDQVLWCRQQLVVTGSTEVPAPPAARLTPAPDPTLEGARTSAWRAMAVPGGR